MIWCQILICLKEVLKYWHLACSSGDWFLANVTSSRKRPNKLSFEEWNIEQHLFIDGSVKSLKGVLLHIGNEYPSVSAINETDANAMDYFKKNFPKLSHAKIIAGKLYCSDDYHNTKHLHA